MKQGDSRMSLKSRGAKIHINKITKCLQEHTNLYVVVHFPFNTGGREHFK